MKAASLFEILIVVGIFSMIVMISFPYSLRLINQNRADAVAKQVAYEIFHQQQEAFSGADGKSYGVAFYSDHLVSYVGTSLATAESSLSIPLDAPIVIGNVSLGGGNEVVFSTGSFRPQQTGYVSVTDSTKVFHIDLNSEGLISYYSL